MSGAALAAVVTINSAYINTEGKTFYDNNPLLTILFIQDSFINDTLEHLRQNAPSGIARHDEQQIEQTLQTMAALVRVYLDIDYSSHMQRRATHISPQSTSQMQCRRLSLMTWPTC
ncbi:MAG: hypothetical protein U5K43_01650 [Halofilum sp. (in: g-proteobacteria)]|nr:hypothetical protein [Halofilum sp. (in: g-proteobacteria)]